MQMSQTNTWSVEAEVFEAPMVIMASSLPTSPTSLIDLPFRRLADEWYSETRGFPRIKDRFKHPAYLKIISWGRTVIPHILSELKTPDPDHWFEALNKITGNNPIQPEDCGNTRKMADAWLKWGRRRRWTN